MPVLRVATIALLGGLQDSKPIPEATDLQELTNMVPLRGRFALRAPLTETARLVDDQGSPANVDHVLALKAHAGYLWAVAWSDTTDKVYIYRLNKDGTGAASPATPDGVLWTGVTSPPKVNMASFAGGSAAAGEFRLYIADYNQTLALRVVTGNSVPATIVGSAVDDRTHVDFDDSGVREALVPALVFPYQSHMWMTGFYQGAVTRAELARFSRPGLIAEVEPLVVNNTTREWWSVDQRQIGTRGEAITGYGYAGGSLILFKDNETHAIHGYDADSWARQTLSSKVGAVGFKAVCWTEDGLCFFWAAQGPHVTDGTTVRDIGEPIRRRIQEAGFVSDVTAEYSADDGLVYFIIPSTGSGTWPTVAPDLAFVFDKVGSRWMKAQFLKTGGGNLKVSMLHGSATASLAAPAAAPSSLSATATSDTTTSLSWTNGDTALDTQTEVWRHTAAFDPPAGTLVATVGSGVAAYAATGLTAKTTYFWEVRHLRNGQYSASAPGGGADVSAKTWLAEPTSVGAQSLPNGVQVSYVNNEAGADIEVYRQPQGGAYTLIVTLTTPGAGSKTYDNTSGSVGVVYTYKLRAKQAAQTTSEYSNEASATFGEASPNITSASHNTNIDTDCPTGPNSTVSWGGTGFGANDTVVIARSYDGGAYEDRATVPIQNGSYADTVLRRSGGTAFTVRYRLRALEGGTVQVDEEFTTLSNHTVDSTPCSEV